MYRAMVHRGEICPWAFDFDDLTAAQGPCWTHDRSLSETAKMKWSCASTASKRNLFWSCSWNLRFMVRCATPGV